VHTEVGYHPVFDGKWLRKFFFEQSVDLEPS